jgi:glycosyltransferase involved in cell wall biosynthesis
MIIGLVSVIVPVYNRENYIDGTIKSILEQSYQSIEIIVINDGSSDNSLLILKQLVEQYPNKIVIIDQKNQGQTIARNNGIRQAKGEFIAFLDSDDLWLKDKLQKQLPLFKNNVGLVYSGIYTIDAMNHILNQELCDKEIKGDIYHQLLIKNRMTGGTVIVKKMVLDQVGLFDETLNAAENWDLWLRISKHSLVDYVNEPLMKYRVHAGNMSKDALLMLSVTQRILSKYLEKSTDIPQEIYQQAYAHLYYRTGVYYFSQFQYQEARLNLHKACDFVPDYKDCHQRIVRTYLGVYMNKLIALLRQKFNHFFIT